MSLAVSFVAIGNGSDSDVAVCYHADQPVVLADRKGASVEYPGGFLRALKRSFAGCQKHPLKDPSDALQRLDRGPRIRVPPLAGGAKRASVVGTVTAGMPAI